MRRAVCSFEGKHSFNVGRSPVLSFCPCPFIFFLEHLPPLPPPLHATPVCARLFLRSRNGVPLLLCSPAASPAGSFLVAEDGG